MNKLEFKLIWIDQEEADFVEVQISIINQRLTATFSCYASLKTLKQQWQKDIVTQVLSGKKIKWEMEGIYREAVTFLVEKAASTGKLALTSKIIFERDKDNQIIEEGTIRIILEPAQLDTFCEQIQTMESKLDATANIG
jgi:hypothetical protein